MPGSYDSETRTITLKTQWDGSQPLPVATVTHFVIVDLLVQCGFPRAHVPEIIETAAIATGLGIARGQIDLVSNSPAFWDRTAWEILPPPFLSAPKTAFALAMAAWIRQETSPAWISALTSEIVGPMKKSLKFLFKTGDSFFDNSTTNANKALADYSPQQWRALANSTLESTQIIGLRHCRIDQESEDETTARAQWSELLIEKLRSGSRDVVLHAIAAVERAVINAPSIVQQLIITAESRDHAVRAKSMLALVQLGKLDNAILEAASKMLDSAEDFVVFAGLTALCSSPEVPAQTMPLVDRAFSRALANCHQEFVNQFAVGYRRWLANPVEHFQQLFVENSPEYLDIAIEALESVGDQFVSLDG